MPHISEIVFVFLSVISVSMIPSRSTHVGANGKISPRVNGKDRKDISGKGDSVSRDMEVRRTLWIGGSIGSSVFLKDEEAGSGRSVCVHCGVLGILTS